MLHRKCGAPQSKLPWHSSMLLHLRRLIPQSRIPRWKSWKVEPSMNMKIYEHLWKSMKISNMPIIPKSYYRFPMGSENSVHLKAPHDEAFQQHSDIHPQIFAFWPADFGHEVPWFLQSPYGIIWHHMASYGIIWHHMASYGHMAHSREKHVFISQNSSNSDCSDCTIVRLHWILLN